MPPRAPRERKQVSTAALTAFKPFLRYSTTRDAYVLRVIGNKTGPVLQPRPKQRDT